MRSANLRYDLVIVGAGIVGLTLIHGLKNRGLRIALIDREDPDTLLNAVPPRLFDQLRFIAITRRSQQIFERDHVWSSLASVECGPMKEMEIQSSNTTERLTFSAAEVGQPCLATIVNNAALQRALFLSMRTRSDLDTFFGHSIATIEEESKGRLITLTSGKRLKTTLIVGADGAQSKVRELANIPCPRHDYQQEALVATVRTKQPHRQTGYQLFLPQGPLAFLPLHAADTASIVWSTTSAEVAQLKAASDADFCHRLTTSFRHRLGQVEETSPRLSFPLRTQQAACFVQPHLALIGDAAHTVHPLAGQGANLGIADAVCLAKTLQEAQDVNRCLGAYSVLRRYERERIFHRRLMGSGVDGIKQLFATSNPVLQKIREQGLKQLNRMRGLKNYLNTYAMGNPDLF
jgi:2-polyprenylphenol 6-hydroxylase